MRTINITVARFLETPRVGFDPDSGQGSITVSYVVGELVPETTWPDGSITAAHYRYHPTATLVGTAQITLGPSDVAGQKMAELITTVATQEGLDLSAGDQIITTPPS
jgi:hypothetical protein